MTITIIDIFMYSDTAVMFQVVSNISRERVMKFDFLFAKRANKKYFQLVLFMTFFLEFSS